MRRFWSIVFYFLHWLFCWVFRMPDFVDPDRLVVKASPQNRLKQTKTKHEAAWDRVFYNPESGFAVRLAEGASAGLAMFAVSGVYYIGVALCCPEYGTSYYALAVAGVVSYTANYLLLFRHNKYLVYFKECENMPNKERKKWAWISLFVVLGIPIFCLCSLAFWSHQL